MSFAASRRDVWGRIEMNSGSRMSFAYSTMQAKVARQRPLCLYFVRGRLGDQRPSDGGGDRTEQTNPGNDAEDLMERIHKRADFKLALGNREAGENRLHHGQWHPGGHDCEREPEAHQEPHVEQGRRHARGDAAAHDWNGIHDRGHVGSDEQAASDPRENHREDEDGERDLVWENGEPNVRSGGHEEPAGGEESGTVPAGKIPTEGADADEGKGERDQKKPRGQRVEPERPLEVEHEDEADGPSRGRCEEVAEDPRGEHSVPEQAQVHHRGPNRPLDRDEGDETRDSGEQHDEVEPGPARNRAEGDSEEGERQAAREEDVPRRIELFATRADPDLLQARVGPDRREHANRDVNPKDRLPTKQPGQDPARHEADQSAAGPRDLIESECSSALGNRKRVRKDRGAVREDETRSDSLDEPEENEALAIWRKAAQPRSDREDREAYIVQAHAAVQIREAADRQEQTRGDENVAQNDPNALDGRRAGQVADDRRQGDQNDVRVEQGHERPDRRVRQHDIFVLHPGTGERPRSPSRLYVVASAASAGPPKILRTCRLASPSVRPHATKGLSCRVPLRGRGSDARDAFLHETQSGPQDGPVPRPEHISRAP